MRLPRGAPAPRLILVPSPAQRTELAGYNGAAVRVNRPGRVGARARARATGARNGHRHRAKVYCTVVLNKMAGCVSLPALLLRVGVRERWRAPHRHAAMGEKSLGPARHGCGRGVVMNNPGYVDAIAHDIGKLNCPTPGCREQHVVQFILSMQHGSSHFRPQSLF